MENKGNKYANTALRISYFNIILAFFGLIKGGIGVISLVACLVSFSYINLAVKNNTSEFKKIKNAKKISTIIAIVALLLIVIQIL